jgi:hypothetical protein
MKTLSKLAFNPIQFIENETMQTVLSRLSDASDAHTRRPHEETHVATCVLSVLDVSEVCCTYFISVLQK